VGDKVKDLVSGYIGELEGKAGKRAPKPVTFSMRLGERDHQRLVRLADNLGVPKTPLAERLLGAAVDEAIEQYAAWASPEDPGGFAEEAFGGAGERGPGPRPPGHGHGHSPKHGPGHRG
jgi:hypothetical protein